MIWQETAPAKLNLTLRVVGRRADGYRLLDSLVVFASVGDRLSWQPDARASGLQLSLGGPQAAGLRALLAEENLVWRAARALSARHGRILAGTLSLDKHLPVSAGIGGGSADAAACLRLLARAWDIADIPADLALALGADVPVCLAGRAAHMTGIGERLQFLPPPPPLPALLVNPGVTLSTVAVFGAHAAARTAFTAALPTPGSWPCDAAGLAALMAAGGNDLTAAALDVQPTIGAVLSELASAPGAAGAAMSGSGATCFALFSSAQACAAAADRLRARHGDWWVMPANLIG